MSGTARLTLRVDATASTGAGHAMRLAALAAAWREGNIGPVTVIGEVTLPLAREALGIAGATFLPAHAATPPDTSVLAVDSYHAPVRAAALAGRVPCRVLVDDVGGEVPVGADLVWNPNPHGSAALYPGFGGLVLSGPAHVPVRRGLPTLAPRGRATVVTLGRSEAAARLAPVLETWAARAPSRTVECTADACPRGWSAIAPEALWAHACRAQALVTAAGVTLLEAAAVGVPVVAVGLADNQRPSLAWADAHGVPVIDLTEGGDPRATAEWLETAVSRARPLPRLQDGSGRVAAMLAGLAWERRAA